MNLRRLHCDRECTLSAFYRCALLPLFFCLFLNATTPLAFVSEVFDDIFNTVVSQVSSTAAYGSACSLPFKTLNTLVACENHLSSMFNKPSAGNDVPGLRAHSLIAIARGMLSSGAAFAAFSGEGASLFSSGVLSDERKNHSPPGLDAFVYVMLLGYLILLAQSKLPWSFAFQRACLRKLGRK